METRVVGRVVTLAVLAASILVGATASAQTQGAVPGPGATVKCESQPGQRQVCLATTSAGVTLARETGAVNCVLGQTWNYDATSVWVQDGCAGEFALGDKEEPFLGNLTTTGQLMAQGAFYEDEAELQDSLSFIDFAFSTGDKIKLFARWEWGVNFIRGGTQFNAGATTTGGFLTLDQVDAPLFGNRLGYVGVDFGPAGRLTVGKQNAVHYDIAGYTTDRWNVFGGQGSIAYPAGTDGGTLGVGRVDQAVSYRVTALRILELGGQLQFRNATNSDLVDGYGVSAQVTVLPGLKLGGAYTETYFSQEVKDAVPGLQGASEYGILGASYSSELLDLGAVWATQRNGDAVRLPTTDLPDAPGIVPVVFDGDGVELYARANLGRFSVLGGFVDYAPDHDDSRVDPDFRVRYFILGGEASLRKNAYAYAEWRIDDDSLNAQGNEGFSVFTIGLRYGFAVKGLHGQF